MGGEASQKLDIHFVDWITNGGRFGSELLYSKSENSPYIDTGIIDNTKYTYSLKFAMFPDSVTGLHHDEYTDPDGYILYDSGMMRFGSYNHNYYSTVNPVTDAVFMDSYTGSVTYDEDNGDYQSGYSAIEWRWQNYHTVMINWGTLEAGRTHTLTWNAYKGEGYRITNNIDYGRRLFGGVIPQITTGYSCYLFARNNAGGTICYYNGRESTTTLGWMKLYAFSIQDENDNYLINLKPGYIIEDGVRVYGAYDTISGNFLTSPNGALFKGPDDYK